MTSEPHIVPVVLPAHRYDIMIGAGLLARAADYIVPHLARPQLAIITDKNLRDTHLAPLKHVLRERGITAHHLTIPIGESSKSFAQLARICNWLIDKQIERDDCIVALGGGVVGDLTGFAAAILRRGTHFIQIPTSLLAQVDSSIGGKTGINVKQGKNLVGAFHQPDMVLIDTDTLATLDDRHLRAGYAEIVKYGALGHAQFFDWLEAHGHEVLARAPDALAHAIAESCRAKAAIVADDEREAGKRALLNLGHTFAHALENLTGYSNTLFHGEAVAIGMCMAFAFSAYLGHCTCDDVRRLQRLLDGAGLPTTRQQIANTKLKTADIMAAMQQDKKVKAGRVRFILARGLGDCFIADNVAPQELHDFLEEQHG